MAHQNRPRKSGQVIILTVTFVTRPSSKQAWTTFTPIEHEQACSPQNTPVSNCYEEDSTSTKRTGRFS
jgi:hypothetical protein